MSSTELRDKFENAKPGLAAWGEFIKATVSGAFEGRRSAVNSDFFAVPPHYRVKQTAEFLAKARRPGKTYQDPWTEITDKVGVRFVTLLGSDAQEICDFITNSSEWSCRHDRDHQEEKISKPTEFLYASEHFILWPKASFEYNGHAIPSDAACEVQVRTLLQHGYSELTHSTIYKGALANDPDAKRKAARGMALIETTDDIFEDVATKIVSVTGSPEKLHESLQQLWADFEIASEAESELSSKHLLDALWPHIEDLDNLASAVQEHFEAHPEDAHDIKTAANELFRLPIALLLYYLAKHIPRRFDIIKALDRDEREALGGITGVNID